MFLVAAHAATTFGGTLVEAEAFAERGGWSVDQQFMDQMGSPYLPAHGLGKPVADAVTQAKIPLGKYRLWVRTRDWCRPMADVGPGKFRVLVNGEGVGEFGTGGSGAWEWTSGPEVSIRKTPAEIRLHDLTGFEGRIDALFFGRGFAKVRGSIAGVKGPNPYDPKGVKRDQWKPVATFDPLFVPATARLSERNISNVIMGENYHTDIEDILRAMGRAGERAELLSIVSHGISPDAKGISMKTEWLERMRSSANELGVIVRGVR